VAARGACAAASIASYRIRQLRRRTWHEDDAAVLAADLHRLLGDECIKALRRALSDVLKA